ncbi:MAG: hypothetical protein PHE77_02945 [Candidatus Pacebacteria bacterium]|nr:hypothetical protein [Candidatus Paceibacterota bacterium]
MLVFLVFFMVGVLAGFSNAEITSTVDPASQIDKQLLEKYFPKPVDWSSMTIEQQRNLRQNQMTYLLTKVIPELEKKSGSDIEKVKKLINQKAVTVDGKTLKGLRAEDKKNTDAIAVLVAQQKANEMALKRLAEEPIMDWNSPQAQGAIKAWVEQNMLGGKKLEEVMGKDVTGKVNTDTLALLNNSFASKALEIKADGIEKMVGEVEGKVSSLDAQVKTLSESVINPLVDKVAELKNKVPNDTLTKTDLDKKADKTEVETLKGEIKEVDNKVDNVRKATAAIALGKKDRALVYIYASYYQEGNIEGFRSWLKSQGKEKMFGAIKKAAEEVAKNGHIKLSVQQKK